MHPLPFSFLISRILKKARGSAIRNCEIHSSAKINSGSALLNVKINRYSYCGYDCTLLNSHIGQFCSIAGRVNVGGMRHPIEYVSTSPTFLSHRDSLKKKFANHHYMPIEVVKIENDVWIGEGAFIKAGVSIGNGAVIGMGSVVTSDVSDYAIVAGNPAKLIRMRFEPHIIEGLLQLKWWDFSDEKLAELGAYFNDPTQLLKKEGLL